MDSDLHQAANCTGPVGGKDLSGTLYFTSNVKTNRRETANVTVGTTGAAIDLDSIFGTGRWNGRYIRMICDQDFEFFFSPTGAAVTLVKGATDGTEGELQKANVADQMLITARYLWVDAASAGTINLSLRNPAKFQQAT